MSLDFKVPIFDVKNLNFSARGHKILSHISLEIFHSEYIAIIGPNGGGKTTLIRMLLGLEKPTEGSVRIFGKKIKEGVVILKGDLAAGKTTLVKAVVKAMGVNDEVTSPTFSLQQKYGEKIYHYDIYNHGLDHFISLGMMEELDKDGLHFVEWGDDERLEILINAEIPTVVIEIEKVANDEREYRIDYAHA